MTLLGTDIIDKNKTGYMPELDGIRTLAFFLVYISHVGSFPQLNNLWSHPIRQAYTSIVNWGWIGVDLFLVLSGFLITNLLLKERTNFNNVSFKLFFIRRMLRIWPLYYLVFILGFFVLPLFNWMDIGYGSVARQEMITTYFSAFLLFYGNLQFAFVIKSISPMVISLWTVCLEEQFYIIWGSLLTLISHKRKLIAVIISLLIAAISLRSYVQDHSASHNEYYYNTITHMDPLLMGALLAISWDTFAEKMKPWGSVSFILSMVIITSIIIYVPDIFQNKKSIIWAMTGIAIAWTLFLFSVITHPVLKRFFSLRPFTELGKITYCMYLIHYPFLITCSAFLHNHMNFLNDFQKWCLIFIVTLSATFFTSRYSWKFYERPFNMLKHNYSRENIEQEFIAPRSRIKFLKTSN